MPHHKSAAKRVITNAKANQRNLSVRSKMRSAIKVVRQAGTQAEAMVAYRRAVAVLDRSAAKGVIKKATANRHKSRLARFAATLAG